MDALLLSAGMDSIALAAWKRPAVALTIDYGQVCAQAELRSARQVCRDLGIKHSEFRADCRVLGSGDLAGIPAHSLAPAKEWWPFRNQLLLTLGAMWAIKVGAQRLLIGTVKTDAFHADATSQFLDQIDQLCQLQEGAVRILAPAINLTSTELVRKSGIDPSILYWAHSCHVANYACGQCRGCQKHRAVMAELGYEPF